MAEPAAQEGGAEEASRSMLEARQLAVSPRWPARTVAAASAVVIARIRPVAAGGAAEPLPAAEAAAGPKRGRATAELEDVEAARRAGPARESGGAPTVAEEVGDERAPQRRGQVVPAPGAARMAGVARLLWKVDGGAVAAADAPEPVPNRVGERGG